jgi:hypothetical protein
VGNARYSDTQWKAYSNTTTRGKTREQIFTQRGIHPDLDPLKVKFREAVDSPANPETTPIILAADETGSMGVLAETIIRGSLGEIMRELYARKPVSDPQILCAGVGDVTCDHAPLQVTQFEAAADVLGEQVKKIWLEGNGGGNNGESYPVVWAFASHKTVCDASRKRGKKGYIFTIGDEQPHTTALTAEQLQRFVGISIEQRSEASYPTKQALADAQLHWHVFHLIVKPVSDQPVLSTWRELLGERAILVENIESLAAGIVSTISVIEGRDPSVGWKGRDAVVVRQVVEQLTA